MHKVHDLSFRSWKGWSSLEMKATNRTSWLSQLLFSGTHWIKPPSAAQKMVNEFLGGVSCDPSEPGPISSNNGEWKDRFSAKRHTPKLHHDLVKAVDIDISILLQPLPEEVAEIGCSKGGISQQILVIFIRSFKATIPQVSGGHFVAGAILSASIKHNWTLQRKPVEIEGQGARNMQIQEIVLLATFLYPERGEMVR